jgi:hypothetical protein
VLPIPPVTTSIRTRIKDLSERDVTVLKVVGRHLGSLASLDLAERIRPGETHDRHDWADRKRRLIPECSSRRAGSITKASNEAYALARRNQWRNLTDTGRAIRIIENKVKKPTRDVPGVEKRKAGYADRKERHRKRHRADRLRSSKVRISSEIESGMVRLVCGERASSEAGGTCRRRDPRKRSGARDGRQRETPLHREARG